MQRLAPDHTATHPQINAECVPNHILLLTFLSPPPPFLYTYICTTFIWISLLASCYFHHLGFCFLKLHHIVKQSQLSSGHLFFMKIPISKWSDFNDLGIVWMVQNASICLNLKFGDDEMTKKNSARNPKRGREVIETLTAGVVSYSTWLGYLTRIRYLYLLGLNHQNRWIYWNVIWFLKKYIFLQMDTWYTRYTIPKCTLVHFTNIKSKISRWREKQVRKKLPQPVPFSNNAMNWNSFLDIQVKQKSEEEKYMSKEKKLHAKCATKWLFRYFHRFSHCSNSSSSFQLMNFHRLFFFFAFSNKWSALRAYNGLNWALNAFLVLFCGVYVLYIGEYLLSALTYDTCVHMCIVSVRVYDELNKWFLTLTIHSSHSKKVTNKRVCSCSIVFFPLFLAVLIFIHFFS